MLFRKITTVYSEKNVKPINPYYGKTLEFTGAKLDDV
jgi:hypothetical protein